MQSRLTDFFKEPLVQFLLLGACIYGAYALFGTPDDEESQRTVYISEAQITNLSAMWEKRWNRPPTETELVGLVRAYMREDILYREAIAMGLDNDDHIIRRRLAQKLEFLTNDLVQMQEPSDEELTAYFEENTELFRAPDRVTFAHVFFNPDSRGDATLDDAAAALERLQAAGDPNGEVVEEGDRFMLQNYFVEASELDVRRAMGSGFADSVMQLESGVWHGPVLSGFGTHLVFVSEFEPAPPPELADVRD
ncbi:MAG: peptidyl-prolyl cis-trans isomerase, partial [Gammaproteobacteria bacterium]|nr:peptidyl-prolyl cis-trans isomerase [Gammaproteobacteria bacterium]